MLGGKGILLRNGELISDFSVEEPTTSFVSDRHPRTAVGVRSNGAWLFVVVDGRQPKVSKGMTLAELAALMKSLGCSDALNLDGGGSTTLYLRGRVVNSPSDTGNRERPVSDAICILPR